MQITLVQSEIEQALKNYINEQVNVKEGMEIVIDFKATRGAEGNTAIIDIRPFDAGANTSASTTKTDTKPQRAPGVKVQPSEDPPFQPDAKPETASDTGASESTAGAAAEAQSAETASAEPATPAAPKKSLFGNLGKPAE